jgi:adenosylcobinamide-phosphate synthase
MTTFVALVLALFVEQALAARGQKPGHRLPQQWVAWCTRQGGAGSEISRWIFWALAVIAPALVAAWVHGLLAHVWGVLAWLWLVLVLVVALGFGDFAKLLAALREAVELNDEPGATRALADWAWADPTRQATGVSGSDWRANALASAVRVGHRQVLAIVVATLAGWLLGSAVFAVVLYVMARAAVESPATEGQDPEGIATVAPRAWGWLDGLAVRASVLGFALSGSFDRVLLVWRENADGFAGDQDRLLLGAAGSALDLEDGTLLAGGWDKPAAGTIDWSHFSGLDRLIWRALSTWLVVFGVLALVRW